MTDQETKKARREAARRARIEAQRARERAKKRKRVAALAVAVAVVLVGVIVMRQMNAGSGKAVAAAYKSAGCSPVKTFPELPRAHISESDPAPKYNSDPPTSGLHFATPANWGSYDETLDNRIVVHNLEHGGIVIHYKDIGNADIDKLNDYADSTEGIIVQPNKQLKTPLALTSWRHVMTCKKMNLKVAKDFVADHCKKGPEKFPLSC